MPFTPELGVHLLKWYYDLDYTNFFRHQVQVLRLEDFQRYEQLLGGQLFSIHKKDLDSSNIMDSVIGCVLVKPDNKSNRACHVGMLIEKKHQQASLCSQTSTLIGNYIYNSLGYKKIIMEILESHETLKQIITSHGFLYEGKFYNEAFVNGEWCNELRYCMMDTYFNKHYKSRIQDWSK